MQMARGNMSPVTRVVILEYYVWSGYHTLKRDLAKLETIQRKISRMIKNGRNVGQITLPF